MIIEGESLIPAGRAKVWQALNDAEVLRRCIPGCLALEQTAENAFSTRVRASVGPISATFDAAVTLTDIEPERGYTIVGEGKGGAAGFARGQARVDLEDADGGTILRYKADVNVGGKLAQAGARLLQGTAKKLSEQFFGGFSTVLAEDAAAGSGSVADATTTSGASIAARAAEPSLSGRSRLVWVGALMVLLVLAGWWAAS